MDLRFHWNSDGDLEYNTIKSTAQDEETIWSLLVEESDYAGSFPDPFLVTIEVGITDVDDMAFVIIEDRYYQVDDAEARRMFAIVHSTPGVDGSGIDFEEL